MENLNDYLKQQFWGGFASGSICASALWLALYLLCEYLNIGL